MDEFGLTRDELLDVALLDVIAEGELFPEDMLIEETRDWIADHESWSPDIWPLVELVPTQGELEARLGWLARSGMVKRRDGQVKITRAGFQMWDGFPWESYAESQDDDEEGER